MQLFRTIIFCISIFLPILSLLDILLSYLFDIKIIYEILIWFWLPIFLGSLFILFSSKIKFITVVFFGIGFITLIIYQVLHYNFSRRKQINDTNYQKEVYRGGYKIAKSYLLFEKTTATKNSEIFFATNTKTGVVSWFEVKLLAETENKLVQEIKTDIGKEQDTLDKRKLWK